jgi:hypothetical protein
MHKTDKKKVRIWNLFTNILFKLNNQTLRNKKKVYVLLYNAAAAEEIFRPGTSLFCGGMLK